MKAKLLELWRFEPVRTVLAPVILTLIVAGLVAAGVDGSLAGIVATVVLGALGFTAQEITRAKVVPTPKARNAEVAVLHDTLTATRQVLSQELGAQGSVIADRAADLAREYIGEHRRTP